MLEGAYSQYGYGNFRTEVYVMSHGWATQPLAMRLNVPESG